MRLLSRLFAGLAALVLLLTLVAGTTLAGGYAEVVLPDGAEAPPAPGEHRDLTFTLLQHGVTPVDWGNVTLSAINADTGERISVPAESIGNGEWTAGMTFPSAGDWSMRVLHEDLETSMATTLSVAAPDTMAWLPAGVAIGLFGLVTLGVTAVILALRARSEAPAGSAPRTASAEG
jgi:hypothetical protein